jgi:hypothetical protein
LLAAPASGSSMTGMITLAVQQTSTVHGSIRCFENI